MEQQQFDFLPEKQKIEPDKYKKQKWRNALQKYCDKEADTSGPYTGYCICGYMRYCDYCEGAGKTNACVKAICEFCKENNVPVNYEDFNFEEFIGNIEEKK